MVPYRSPRCIQNAYRAVLYQPSFEDEFGEDAWPFYWMQNCRIDLQFIIRFLLAHQRKIMAAENHPIPRRNSSEMWQLPEKQHKELRVTCGADLYRQRFVARDFSATIATVTFLTSRFNTTDDWSEENNGTFFVDYHCCYLFIVAARNNAYTFAHYSQSNQKQLDNLGELFKAKA